MTAALAAREPGSPILAVAGLDAVECFGAADDLARRIHDLRRGAGLDCDVGHASIDGCDAFPAVLVWLAQPRRFLAVAAGPGVRRPSELLAALARTAVRRLA